jgi:ELWxxDGT repeat protein
MTCIQDMLYFTADDGVHGNEAWVSDGTPAGTRMVADVNPTGSSNPRHFTPHEGNILFTARNDTYGTEMYLLTPGIGAELVVDILPGPDHGSPNGYTPFKNGFVMAANLLIDDILHPELFFTDGTASGTHLIKRLNEGGIQRSPPADFTVLNDVVVFRALTDPLGFEPWRTDGTEEGTYLLKDIDPRPNNIIEGSSTPREFVRYGDYVFFSAHDADRYHGLWRTDGTVEGTTLVSGGPLSSPGALFKEVNGFLYFMRESGLYRMDRSYAIQPIVPNHHVDIHAWHRGLLMTKSIRSDTGQEIGAVNAPPWVVSLEPEPQEPVDTQEAAFLATFSEPVIGVDPSDFVLTWEGLWQPSLVDAVPVGDGTTWRIIVDTGLGDGTLFLRLIDNGTITDSWHLQFASERNPPAPMDLDGYGKADGSFVGTGGLAVDKPAPTVALSTTATETTALTVIPVTATFEREVTGFTAEDIQVSNASLSNFAGGGATYTFDLAPADYGPLTAFVPADAAMDFGSLGNAPSNELRITYGLHLRLHSADTNGSHNVELPELLRVIQLYNVGGYHCDPSNDEDGYNLGAGEGPLAKSCIAHDGDHTPQDWEFSLNELLRIIQFFNFRAYHFCPLNGTEDGFCTGPGV